MTAAGCPQAWRLWPRVRLALWRIVALVVVVATVGCSSSSRDRGRIRVAGVVAFDGKPLGHGSVLFARIGDNDVASSSIRSGGNFTASLLSGDYDVAVRCFATNASAEPAAEWADPRSLIPERYTDAKTSGLKVTAAPGMSPFRLDLVQ